MVGESMAFNRRINLQPRSSWRKASRYEVPKLPESSRAGLNRDKFIVALVNRGFADALWLGES
jgi:hypothetical protein